MASNKPNFLMIMADDIGVWNVGAYNRGMMGGSTPNIDRVFNEGALFTDAYAEASCTAGRAAFITGQVPLRTGLTTVGMPASPGGIQAGDPTIAELLKPEGYRTAQVGKNHLGDRNEFLPTVHGFDEFYGNLYHLNAEEEPEQHDYPHDIPEMKEIFGPRGVLHCKATDVDDPTEDPRFGRVGKQTIEDTGPLTRERMKTVEKDLLGHSIDFMQRAVAADEPFFLWHNTTRMHVWTRLSEEWDGKTKYGVYADGMQELDWVVGELLDELEELGIADNTVVVFATDNGAEEFLWPDGGLTPFRGEKGLGWEGGFRAPFGIRWPGTIEPGQVLNGIFSLQDVLPTVLAAAGKPDIKEELLDGYQAGEKHFRVHLDGHNMLPYLTGEVDESPRRGFFYHGETELYAIRAGDWKVHFQTKDDWFTGQLVRPTMPMVVNLRVDPFEKFMEAPGYPAYAGNKLWAILPAAAILKKFIDTFEEYPPSQDIPGFNPADLMGPVYQAAANRQGN